MIYTINKTILLEEAIHRHINKVETISSEKIVSNTNELFSELDKLCSKYKISKDSLIIFGSAVLGLKGLRSPNDLDIGIKKNSISILKDNFSPAKGSYGAQYDIGKISFIHELALPKIKGQSLFSQKIDTYKGYNIITFDQWKEMQKHDPLQKDKKFLKD